MATSLSSCMPKLSQKAYLVDYRTASQNGKVFISESNSVNFEYEPIGSLIVIEKPGAVDKKKVSFTAAGDSSTDPIYGEEKNIIKKYLNQTYQSASIQSALNFAADQAIQLGGDGIINLKMEILIMNKEEVAQISGMVIKRK